VGVDYIELTQDKETCWAVVKAAMDLRVHKMQGVCPLTEELSPSVKEPCSMELYVRLSNSSNRCLSHPSRSLFLMVVVLENTFRIYCNFQD
jgi:hypothetical protein